MAGASMLALHASEGVRASPLKSQALRIRRPRQHSGDRDKLLQSENRAEVCGTRRKETMEGLLERAANCSR